MNKYGAFIVAGIFLLVFISIVTYVLVSDKVNRKKVAKTIIDLQEKARKYLLSLGYTILDVEIIANIDTTENLEIFYRVKDNKGQVVTYLAHLKDNNEGFEVIKDDLYQFL